MKPSLRRHVSGNIQYYRNKHGVEHYVEHRVNGPSEVSADGSLSFEEDGHFHRNNGPAYSDPRDGPKYYNLEGQGCSSRESVVHTLRDV